MRARALAAAVVALAVTACAPGNVFSLDVGECFDDPRDPRAVSDVEIVDCDDFHDNEVVRVESMPDGGFPGGEAVNAAATEVCAPEAVAGYVGADPDLAGLATSSLAPTEETWDRGDREIVCFVSAASGEPLDGSVRARGS